uniref:Uncharacterized protein n=1 Tax=Anguilla anguilla TaxID=7936 RepID=A0A0E9RBF7_ANGAN
MSSNQEVNHTVFKFNFILSNDGLWHHNFAKFIPIKF